MSIEQVTLQNGIKKYRTRISTPDRIYRKTFDTREEAENHLKEQGISYARNYPLTLEERQIIEKNKNLSGGQIARLINRGKNSVNVELRLNGGRDKYDAQKAHERSLEARKRINRKQPSRPDDWEHPLVVRIRNLEMQFDILLDEIKSLKETISKLTKEK